MKISMYTLSTCPWCRKTKQFFKDKKVPFDYVDYDLVGEEEKERILKDMSKYGSTAFPFVKIDDEVIIGYNPEKYSELLKKGKK